MEGEYHWVIAKTSFSFDPLMPDDVGSFGSLQAAKTHEHDWKSAPPPKKKGGDKDLHVCCLLRWAHGATAKISY